MDSFGVTRQKPVKQRNSQGRETMKLTPMAPKCGVEISGVTLATCSDSEMDEIKQAIYFLLYTSDAADDSLRLDLGGRRIIKK